MGYVRWFGHAAFEVNIDGVKVLIDPWVSNPLSNVKVDELKNIDLILVSHDHFDHLGDTVEVARKTGAQILSVPELSNYLKDQGLNTIGMNIGGTAEFKGLKITMTQAFHTSSRGSPVGYVIKGSESSIYHTGDTGLFGDMKIIGELYKPKISLLPIGGYYTLGINEALVAVELIKPETVIPMHYNTFPVIKADVEKFKELTAGKGVKCIVLKPGESYTF
jgi:L-ascorbate metabolism protein UlaG (beta-lactamase superfamily)